MIYTYAYMSIIQLSKSLIYLHILFIYSENIYWTFLLTRLYIRNLVYNGEQKNEYPTSSGELSKKITEVIVYYTKITLDFKINFIGGSDFVSMVRGGDFLSRWFKVRFVKWETFTLESSWGTSLQKKWFV